MTPAAKRHAVRSQRVALTVCYKPIRMLLEDVRLFFGDEGRHPDGWFKAARPNLLQHTLHVPTEGRAGLQPVAHRRLIAVVDRNVLKARRVFRDEVQIVEHLLRGDPRPETIPGAPARWRRRQTQWRMIHDQTPGQLS